ncbi:MAG: TIGR03087 family PEP-CTERM/XrtA system glycosyltransferase [Candidatus Omnitrophica bacterium]|nr:TIGR03087 family PEP-CTERM/XrtA system glycosyltransferase [Candidatus Omnitrophota bacterium]
MNILFITHRVPYPPNKGEKIRAFYFIRHLSEKHRIFLYSLCDDKNDLKYREELKKYCVGVNLYCIHPLSARINALMRLFTRYPVTFGYFWSARMKRDIRKKVNEKEIDLVFASSSSTAQYALDIDLKPKIIDFIDMDSDKWAVFAKTSIPPFSSVYALESNRIRKWEKSINEIFTSSIVTTEDERKKLEAVDPRGKEKTHVIANGIDLDYFIPQVKEPAYKNLIFTGQMDYLPNIDAVKYFYKDILPLIRRKVPDIRFFIVGRNPSLSIKNSCGEAVVTGEVNDIRPYLTEAAVFVAPLRISFGIPNKVLQAMALGIPVVATSQILRAIRAVPERDILIGDTPEEFARKVIELLGDKVKRDAISKNATKYIKDNHNWKKNLSILDNIVETAARRL